MNRLSTIAAASILLAAPISAQEVLYGSISISRTSTTANRTSKPVKLKQTPSKIDIITAEDIKKNGYRSITEALSSQAGISIENLPGNIPAVYIRGMGGSDVLLVIDGEPIVDYTSPSPSMIDAVDINSIEKIEILKGAQSGVWGANAVAGVINIVTTRARKDYASVSLGAGSYGTRTWGFETSQKTDSFSIVVSHHEDKSTGFSALGKMDDEADGHQNQDSHIQASITNGTDTLSIFIHDYKSNYDYDGVAYTPPTYAPTPQPNDANAKGNRHLLSQGLKYHYEKDHLFADAKLSLTTIDRELKDNLGFPTDYKYSSSKLSAIVYGGYRSEHQVFTAGAEKSKYSATSDTSAFVPPTVNGFDNDALFANYTYTFDDLLGAQTTVNAAIRYDHFDTFTDKTTYRLGIKRNCHLLSGIHTSANIYSAYKVPSLFQYSNAQGVLKPEYTTGYDINLGYKDLINVSYFNNKTTDKITYTPNPTAANPYGFYYTNSSSESNVSGIEISGRYAFGNSGFSLGANFTHLFQDHLIRRAQNSANLFAEYRLKNTTLNLAAHYEGGRDAIDGTRLPSYKTLNASVNTRVSRHLELSAGIKNILDTKYQTAKGYNTAGRSLYARIKYTF